MVAGWGQFPISSFLPSSGRACVDTRLCRLCTYVIYMVGEMMAVDYLVDVSRRACACPEAAACSGSNSGRDSLLHGLLR